MFRQVQAVTSRKTERKANGGEWDFGRGVIYNRIYRFCHEYDTVEYGDGILVNSIASV